MSSGKPSRRKKRRKSSGGGPMPMGGAGLMRFFEDSSIGIKIGPAATLIFSVTLILIVILANIGVFELIISPA
ncbi:MAG: preprotein translocase subunit Sec61beta [Candidatus Lokiarchaeota archaeon]|nr:preprotein translocase subunit Sec61beta [Candidatus Lokiarchaeota archaeon]